MKQLCLGIIVAISLTFPAFANPPQLRGHYVWTYSDTCLVPPSGFSAPPGLAPAGAAALGQTYSTSGADTGIEDFNADGTGFVKGGGITVNLGSPAGVNKETTGPGGLIAMWPFKTKEVALLLAAMDALAPAFEGNLGIDVVRKRAEQYFADNPEEARRALVDENRTPKEDLFDCTREPCEEIFALRRRTVPILRRKTAYPRGSAVDGHIPHRHERAGEDWIFERG